MTSSHTTGVPTWPAPKQDEHPARTRSIGSGIAEVWHWREGCWTFAGSYIESAEDSDAS